MDVYSEQTVFEMIDIINRHLGHNKIDVLSHTKGYDVVARLPRGKIKYIQKDLPTLQYAAVYIEGMQSMISLEHLY